VKASALAARQKAATARLVIFMVEGRLVRGFSTTKVWLLRLVGMGGRQGRVD
jgi:hypothetical protein